MRWSPLGLKTLRANIGFTWTFHIWFSGKACALWPIRPMYGIFELHFCKYKLSLQHCIHNHLVLIWFKGKVHQTAALTIYLHFCRNLLLLWYLLDCRYALWFSLHFNSNFTENHLHFKGFLMFKKSKHGSRVSRTRTTDMTSWDLGPHEEDLDKSQFSKMASGESFYCTGCPVKLSTPVLYL